MGLKDVNAFAVLEKYAHILDPRGDRDPDRLWAKTGQFTVAVQRELDVHCKLIRKPGGTRCDGPGGGIDCDKIVDVDPPFYIYDLVGNGGSPDQRAGLGNTGVRANPDDNTHPLISADGTRWMPSSVPITPPPPPSGIDPSIAIERVHAEVVRLIGRRMDVAEGQEAIAHAVSLGYTGGLVPQHILDGVLLWARKTFAPAPPPIDLVRLKSDLLALRSAVDVIVAELP